METGKNGKQDATKNLRISPAAFTEVQKAFHDYSRIVLKAGLSQWAESEYIDRVDMFLRWLKGEFQPGSRATGVRVKSGRKKIEEEEV
jgi:hypothetical protein